MEGVKEGNGARWGGESQGPPVMQENTYYLSEAWMGGSAIHFSVEVGELRGGCYDAGMISRFNAGVGEELTERNTLQC